MPALMTFLRHVELALRLHAAVPGISYADAFEHASAAISASTDRVGPELLLGVAFIESRFDPTATSRVVNGHRKTGRYPSQTPPSGLDAKATLFCGPLQTIATTWSECLAFRDIDRAYAAGAAELEKWLADRRVRGNVTRALAGHGCGNYGVTTGRCNAYPSRVLWFAERFRSEPARVSTTQARRAGA
jgi:hypothetical protein